MVETWAILESCSQGNFVKTNLIKELKVQGINTSATIEDTEWGFQAFNKGKKGLEVSNSDGEKEEGNNLPIMFTQNELPAVLDEIATSENIKQWEYLHRIITDMKTSGNLDVQLLICLNGLKALEPQEIVASKSD